MVVIFFMLVLAVDASKFGPSAWGGSWTIFLQNWWSTMGRIEPTSQTFAWKKYRVQTLIEVLGNELNRASMVAETTHHFKFGESLQTTDEIKVDMPYRSPFITVETLCCLLVKLCPFYNNYSRLVAAMISFVLVTAHDLCIVILVWSFYLQSSVQTR